MVDREIGDKVLPLLSISIGIIMEEELDAAVSALPVDRDAQRARFADLQRAGQDIAALAQAAEVIIRRSGG